MIRFARGRTLFFRSISIFSVPEPREFATFRYCDPITSFSEPLRKKNFIFSHAKAVDFQGTLDPPRVAPKRRRSEEHTSELQSLMRISYAVFCLTKKNNIKNTQN